MMISFSAFRDQKAVSRRTRLHHIQRKCHIWLSCARVPWSGNIGSSKIIERVSKTAYATYKSTRVLPHRHGVHHPRSNPGFIVGSNGRFHARYAPRAVSFNVPPSKDRPERIGTHSLTIHWDGFPMNVDWARTGERRRVCPLLD